MAWFCTGKTNAELINNLLKAGIINNPRVADAMRQVDRGNYTTTAPYTDSPQSIGFEATISAPHMHAYALNSLTDYLKPGCKVLDVGSGSGYLTACLALMAGEGSRVIGIDHIQGLVDAAIKNMERDHPELLASGRVEFKVGDGRKGYPPEAPYDCIHVGAASSGEPKELIDQIKAPGRMFVPVGSRLFGQEIIVYTKDEASKLTKQTLMGVQYVPLTDPDSQTRGR